jgi:6-hydroxytryprostatin B O-methyltransferase
MILHDWPFTQAVNILKHLVDALKPGARLVIMDTVLPLPGSIPATQEAVLRVRDLTMWQAFNSKERELEEWTTLFTAVDPTLRIHAVVQPPGSSMAIMEVARETTKPQVDRTKASAEVAFATTMTSGGGAAQIPVMPAL